MLIFAMRYAELIYTAKKEILFTLTKSINFHHLFNTL